MNKKLIIWLVIPFVVIVFALAGFIYSIYVPAPEVDEAFYNQVKVEEKSKDFYVYKDNWIKKSKTGLWEMYVEGKPFEIGVINGKLSRHLVVKQEVHFVEMLTELIPSRFYINFLKYFVAWFNRDLDENITDEYKKEIYGVSLSASPEYSFIGPNYYRMLNYHAAHDIGHLLQELHMVGCTSFSAWGGKTSDSSLIVGRNFDFYVGDGFAEDKIIAFINPDAGNKFMMVTWGGMIGAVSGMNEKGLTVTINAARSEIPTTTATPISIVAREVLQYAGNIDEAYEIISKRKTFVSQTFMVASDFDNKTVVIEKSPSKTDIFSSEENSISCANHFQSKGFENDEYNKEHMEETSTPFRYARMKKLVDSNQVIRPEIAATILRDTRGINGEKIGYGNERALNQLQGHHSIIFKPSQRLVWVSTQPWQAGKYVAYDLKKVFNKFKGLKESTEIIEEELTIESDTFATTDDFLQYLEYRKLKPQVEKLIKRGVVGDDKVEKLKVLNPEFYLVYMLAGDYYKMHGQTEKANANYKISLTKSIPWKTDSLRIVENMTDLKR